MVQKPPEIKKSLPKDTPLAAKKIQKKYKTIFSYPDYTVGIGIAPIQNLFLPRAWRLVKNRLSQTITAGEEFRLAPKTSLL